MKGTVRWFSPKKGFGFIFCEELGGDVFVHVSNIQSDSAIKCLYIGDTVEFEIEKVPKGIKAIKVVIIEKGVKYNGKRTDQAYQN